MSATIPNYLEAGHLLSAYGERLGLDGDDAGAQKALDCAMAIAKHQGDLTLEMVTLVNAAWVDVHHLRLQESLGKSLRAIELAQQVADPLSGRPAYLHAARVEYNRADLSAARRYAETYLTLSERTGNPAYIATALYLNQKVAALGGDWQTARDFFDRGLREVPQNTALMLVSVQTVAEYAVGDFNQGEALLGRLIDFFHTAPPEPDWVHVFVSHVIAVVSHITGTTNHSDVAKKAVETVLTSQRVSPLFAWVARTSLALLAAQEGDKGIVQEQYSAVQGQRGIHMLIDVDRLLGILAAAIGELNQATTHFKAALTIWGKGPYPEHAWIAYDFADTLLQRGQPGDKNRATTLLDEALSISDKLGMNPLKERILIRQESA